MSNLDPRTVTLEGITPVIPISQRLAATDVTTPFSAYVTLILDRITTLLKALYNTTPDRVRSIRYTRKIDGRDFRYSIVFIDVTGQSQNVVKVAMLPEEKELFLLYNKMLVPESEEWVRTIGRLSVVSINRQNGVVETSLEEVNLQDILYLQFGYELAVGNLSTFLPWRVVRETIRFRPTVTPFVIPGTGGISVNWVVSGLDVEYGAYQNMALPFSGSNVIVFSSEIIRPNNPSNNQFLRLLDTANSAFSSTTRPAIESFQYNLGLQYDNLAQPDSFLESQLLAAAVDPTLRTTRINAQQSRVAISNRRFALEQQALLASQLEFNPKDLLESELEDTLRRTSLLLENDTVILQEDLEELEQLQLEGEGNWEPEQQNRAIQLRRDIARLQSSIAIAQDTIREKNEILARLDSVEMVVDDAIQERETARRILSASVNIRRNKTLDVDNNPDHIDIGLGEVLQGASGMNVNGTGQEQAVLVVGQNIMSEF
jgi:hypothetical protein